jgi:two-component system, NtrC family, response regulator HydG
VVVLVLPPLRDRAGDVEMLARTFVERIARGYGLPVPEIGAAAREALRRYQWPGNIRELRNVVERAVVLSPPGTLEIETLGADAPAAARSAQGLPFPATLEDVVRTAARVMLDLTDGNKSEAARRLGISRPRLQRLLDGQVD